MVGHGGSSASSYLANPTSPIPSHSASIVATSAARVKFPNYMYVLNNTFGFCIPLYCVISGKISMFNYCMQDVSSSSALELVV